MDKQVYIRMDQLEQTHWWFVARRKILSSFLEKLVHNRKNPKILEAGCGTGGNLQMLKGFGSVSTFEPDGDARGYATEKSGLEIQSGFMPQDIPFKNESFDLVVAFDVLEHVKHDTESLTALSERLSEDGQLLITVPALPFLWSGHDELHHHHRRYTKQHLKTVLEKAGYKVEKISYFNSFLFPMIAMIRSLNKVLGRNSHSDESMPSKWLNSLLTTVFSSEKTFLKFISFPVGVSLIAVAHKDTAQALNKK